MARSGMAPDDITQRAYRARLQLRYCNLRGAELRDALEAVITGIIRTSSEGGLYPRDERAFRAYRKAAERLIKESLAGR